jgi:hypothetical protein
MVPITRPTQPSLAYIFLPLPLTKHKYKTRTSSYTFLFAPLKLNFIALSENEQVHNVEDIASKLRVLLTSLPH